MPVDPNYIAPRGEPIQIAAGIGQNTYTMPFAIAAISIDNYTEFFVLIEPSNRPGFWIAPYQVSTIVNLYPPATSIRVTQQRLGPTGVSGAVSIGGTGTVNMIVLDAPLSPQSGIIASPPFQYLFNLQTVQDSGSPVTLFTVPAGFNAIINKLDAYAITFESSGTDVMLSSMFLGWSSTGVDPNRFRWYQTLSPESPAAHDDFDAGVAIIKAGLSLQCNALLDNASYYSFGGPSIRLLVNYYLVIA